MAGHETERVVIMIIGGGLVLVLLNILIGLLSHG